ncbi:hypothetical protein [Butyrivibrio sp. AC2005]|uniref:hypothetical protein n=1 Tax=Butyrivibrio sp. AC2005 TaxID=1280672 RepID=UPI0003FC8EB4|nr:hypothetical protein [Butyrivibrio sp. AC2005]
MVVSGIELYPVDITSLDDTEPVYIEFTGEGVFKSQWGIVDKRRKVTIHKDFTITFNKKCRYFGLHEEEKKDLNEGVIVKF